MGEIAPIGETNFELPGQIGEVYRGKVADVYTVDHPIGELFITVRTDRISVFDKVLPDLIPHKGQVLNEMSVALLEATAGVAPNWVLASPDANVSVGWKAQPVKVEMIVRGFLLGSAWRSYKNGSRQLCGYQLPDGMREFQPFDTPLVTPTTKSEHDEDLTEQDIFEQGLATAGEYRQMSKMALALFARGQEVADRRGLVLADTKFEIGRTAARGLIVIDEVLTPDASRYFESTEYRAYLAHSSTKRPEQLSKEFVREWVAAHGFTNQPGETPPKLPEEFITEVSARYIDLYERMLGKRFQPATEKDPAGRIEENLVKYLNELKPV